MERNAYIVVFDELKCEKEETNEDKTVGVRSPSYYLFNEILKNSTIIIPIIYDISDGAKNEKCPDHVIMVIPLDLVEIIEEIIPTYWESYIYWQYTSVKVGINPYGLGKVVNEMFHWFMQMKKMPYIVITGFDNSCSEHLSRIDIISCLAHNGLPDDRVFFIDDGQCKRDVYMIEDLVKIVEQNISFMNK